MEPKHTIKCFNIGILKTTNFPFVPNGKLMVLNVPVFKHIRAASLRDCTVFYIADLHQSEKTQWSH